MTARRRLSEWMAGRDGVARAEPEPGDDARREAALAALDALPELEQKPPREFPPEQQRLGDRRPEFSELSDRVAEANKRSSGGPR